MKKCSLKICFLYYCFVFTVCSALFSQSNKVYVENWEKWHNRRQPPEKVMDAIGLKPGMTIGEIGAGTGRYAVWLAHRVGATGKVYANDIDRDALLSLDKRCETYRIHNLQTIVGEVTNPLFPETSLDIAFMINTYHHVDDPVTLLKNTIPALKPNSILAIVECNPEKIDHETWHATSKKQIAAQVEQAGFKLVRIETFLKEDDIYIFEVKK